MQVAGHGTEVRGWYAQSPELRQFLPLKVPADRLWACGCAPRRIYCFGSIAPRHVKIADRATDLAPAPSAPTTSQFPLDANLPPTGRARTPRRPDDLDCVTPQYDRAAESAPRCRQSQPGRFSTQRRPHFTPRRIRLRMYSPAVGCDHNFDGSVLVNGASSPPSSRFGRTESSRGR